ncbi:MAG: hypothetical protein QNK23_10175 [Crocinitomicaceae bacterium]|nr:hypothetical protein [Crocinitomicaceae bacterium]
MKRFWIIAVVGLVAVIVAQMMPMNTQEYMNASENAFDNDLAWFFIIPALVSTICFIAPNHILGIIGSVVYALTLFFACFLLHFISTRPFYVQFNVGIGLYLTLLCTSTMTALGVIHSVKLSKARPSKQSNEIIDEL